MSRYLHVRSLMLLVAATTLTVTAQQPGSAGATRPRLEVLKSLPEGQLFSLMNVLSTSLGVRCDYCHVQTNPDLSRTPSNVGGWVWDSDEKIQKRKARDMMKMVVALNTTHFGGDARVTCYTCHRGATKPLHLPTLPPPLPGSGRTSSTRPLPSADRVWAAYVAAVGSAEEAPGNGTIMRGWDERPEGRYGRFEITIAALDRYRLTLTTSEGTTNQGMDSAGAWGTANNQVQRFSTSPDLARMRQIAMRYRAVKQQPPNLRVVGIDRVDDHDAYVLEGTFDSVTTRRSYFDVVTGLLRREITTTKTLLIPLEEQVDYDDYRNVNGVQLPYLVRISDGAPYSTTTRTILEIRRNVPVDPALFRAPSR